jgi:hypothetical protein
MFILPKHFKTFGINIEKYIYIKPLKTKLRLLYLKTRSRVVNTFHIGYKNQPVYAVSGTSRCLFSDKYALFKDPVRTAL